MACVTLKRPLEFDPIHHVSPSPSSCSPRPHKRRKLLVTPGRIFASQQTSWNYEAPTPSLSQRDIAERVKEELVKMRCRQLLHSPPLMDGKPSMEIDDKSFKTPSTPPRVVSPGLPSPPGPSNSSKDKPIFSFQQVKQLCEQMLRDREEKVRLSYEAVLADQLVEQYNNYISFTAKQIHEQLAKQGAPSYMS